VNQNPSLYRLERSLTREQVVEDLASMPRRLREAVDGLAPTSLTRRPSPDQWSAFETIGHVRDATLVYALRFRFIVLEEDPLLPNYDEDRWAAESLDRPDDMQAILDEIAASRADLVRLLSRLPEGGWRRTGRHEAIGSVVLEDYARHQVVHEEMHLAQIAAAAGP
jgi:hypothetical protein